VSTFRERVNNTLAVRSETKGQEALLAEFKSDQVRRAANSPRYISWGTPQWSAADWDLDRLIRDGYERVIWVWRGVDAIAEHAANLTIRAVSGPVDNPNDRTFVDDPILRNLNLASWPGKTDKDAPIEMAWQFRYRLSSLLLLSKVGVYVEVVRKRGGGIFSLSLIHPGHCRPIPDIDTMISGFRVDMPDGGYSDLPAYNPNGNETNSILWVRKPHPTDPLSATTPLQAAGISIDLDFWARLYNRTFMQNDGRPGGLLAIKGGMEQGDVDELRGRFGGGPQQAGRTTVIEADAVSWVDTAMSPRDAQYVQSRGITKEEILLALGVPESVIGNASGRTFDNADNEREIFWEFTMLPHVGIIERAFEALTAGGLYDDVRLWHDTSHVDSLQRQQRRKVAEARVDVQLGYKSIGEFRSIAGDPEIDDPSTRVLWIPAAGRSPVGLPADVAKAKDVPIVAPPAGAPGGKGTKPGATVPGQGVMLPSMRRTLSEIGGKDDEPAEIEWKGWASWPAIEAKALAPGVTPGSTMIAADVEYPKAIEDAVMLAAGEYGMQPLDPDEWHVTLAFMGQPDDGQQETIDETLDDNLPSTLLTGTISSPAVFGERGGPRAIVLLVDIPGLAEYRTDLVRALEDAGVPQQSEHGYTAHMTVGYVEPTVSPDDLAALLTVLMSQAGQAITLPSVALYVGSKRYEGPGEEPDPFDSAGETGESQGKAFDPNQPRDPHTGEWSGAYGRQGARAVGTVVGALDGVPIAKVADVIDGIEFSKHRDDTWELSKADRASVAAAINEVLDVLPGMPEPHVHHSNSDGVVASAGGWPQTSMDIGKAYADEPTMVKYSHDWGDGGSIAGGRSVEDVRRATIVHEMGHGVQRALEHHSPQAKAAVDALVNEPRTFRQAGAMIESEPGILDREFKRWQVDGLGPQYNRPASIYASENEREWFAEAFTDGFLNGPSASESGKRAYAIAQQYLGPQ
jgi:2'-5' RNA ligase